MDHREVGRIWDENAEAWTKLVRMGCDLYRDHVNTPAFFAMLPDVSGLSGLDIGCGEGYNTRLLAGRGAKMTAIDVSARFLALARQEEHQRPLGIRYQRASAVELPFRDASFDFAAAFMSLMDVPETERVIREAHRIIRPGGFLQFSVSHPCFATPRWKWVRDKAGRKVALECGDYFHELDGDVEQWIFGATPEELKRTLPEFRIPRFTRTLSTWLNLLVDTGFVLERFDEPRADDQTLRRYPQLADTREIAYFLIVRCRKPRRSSLGAAIGRCDDQIVNPEL